MKNCWNNPKYQHQLDRFKSPWHQINTGIIKVLLRKKQEEEEGEREKKKGKQKTKQNWHNTTSSEKMNGALSLALKAAVVVRLIMVGG